MGETKPDPSTVDLLWNLFVNRVDRYLLQDGNGVWGWTSSKLTKKVIAQHLAGDAIIGIAEMDRNSETRFILLDIDGPDHDVGKTHPVVKRLRAKIDAGSPFLKNAARFVHTGNGVHLIIFFRQKAPARLLRDCFLINLLEKCNFRVEGSKWFDGDVQMGEVFPQQDEISKDGFAVRLPLGIHRNGNRSKVMFEQDLASVIPIPLSNELINAFKSEPKLKKKGSSEPIPNWNPSLEKVILPACIIPLTNRKSVHDGMHQNNLDLVQALLVSGYSTDAIHAVFKKMKGYHYGTTQYQTVYTLKQIRKGILPPTTYRCDTYTNATHGLSCDAAQCVRKSWSTENPSTAAGAEPEKGPPKKTGPSRAERIVQMVREERRRILLFTNHKTEPYAQIPKEYHTETLRIRSRAFKEYLTYQYQEKTKKSRVATRSGMLSIHSQLSQHIQAQSIHCIIELHGTMMPSGMI